MPPYLYAEISSIDVIPQEKIPRLGWITTDLKKLHQVEILAMHITTHCDWRIHLQQVRLALQDLCAHVDDEQSLLLCQPTLALEVLFQERQIWLVVVVWGEELFVCGRIEGGRLHFCNTFSIYGAQRVDVERGDIDLPLHTRSCVLTCVPSSIVCSEKSISGIGFFSLIALTRFPCPSAMLQSLSSYSL